MSMSSRVMSGSSALSTSSWSPVWKMSTGGTHAGEPVLKPKSRNGSQRTMVMTLSLVNGVCVFRVDDLGVLHIRIRQTIGRGVRGVSGAGLLRVQRLRNRVRRVLQGV